MDQNFESVPFQYLSADRGLLVNSEYLLQIEDIENPDVSPGKHWYVDALTFEPSTNTAYLCEFTFSKSLQGLKKRLSAWPDIAPAIARDSGLQSIPVVRPWAFVPEETVVSLVNMSSKIGFDGSHLLPPMKITPLEMTLPWRYRFWKRCGEAEKLEVIPPEMR